MDDRLIAFLVRETGWSLEYIRDLPVSQINILLSELSYLKVVEEYRLHAAIAAVMVTMANLWSKHRATITEIIGQPPGAPKEGEKLMATEIQTIKLADGKEYRMAPLTLNLLSQFEEKYDKPLSELVKGQRLLHMRYLLYLRLHQNYPELTEEQIGDLVTVETLSDLGKIVGA